MIEWGAGTNAVSLNQDLPFEKFPPYISSLTQITASGDQEIEILGQYFTPGTSLNIPGVIINDVTVRSPNKIIANISKSGLSGFVNINLANGLNSNSLWIDGIKSQNIDDPLWQYVSLFIPGNGANDSKNIIDQSTIPKTISIVGDTKISTSQSKYGGSSIYFDGVGDLIQVSNHLYFDFGTTNFTLEFWIYPLNNKNICWKGDGLSASSQSIALTSTASTLYINGGSSSTSSSYSLSLNTWQHLALVRNGTSQRLFKNGLIVASQTLPANASVNTVPALLQFGGGPTSFINAYLQSIRVTNLARYTASFNPETDTYLNI